MKKFFKRLFVIILIIILLLLFYFYIDFRISGIQAVFDNKLNETTQQNQMLQEELQDIRQYLDETSTALYNIQTQAQDQADTIKELENKKLEQEKQIKQPQKIIDPSLVKGGLLGLGISIADGIKRSLGMWKFGW